MVSKIKYFFFNVNGDVIVFYNKTVEKVSSEVSATEFELNKKTPIRRTTSS